MKKVILKVGGMSCSACSNKVEKYLNKQEGIIEANVNLVLAQAFIKYKDNLKIEDLAKFIEESGYKYEGIYNEKEEDKKDNSKTYLLILGLLIIILMYISMSHIITNHIIHSIVLFVLTIPYLIYGKDIIIKGIKNLLNKSPNMDSLVTIGVIVSFIYSLVNMILVFTGNKMAMENIYFETSAMVLFFVKLGRYIENINEEKTKEVIKALVQVTPESALLKGGKEVTIDEVKKGDILVVKPGMKVAVDGIITSGSAHFDESFITGESTPVKKKKNDKVVAGSINYDGVVEYKAEKIGPKSTISEMVNLVVEASNTKMPIGRIVDKVSYYFVPFIMLVALITFIVYLILGNSFNESLIRLVTILVVACPCALGLATPLAIIVSIGLCAKNGIIVKTSEILELANKIDVVVFDKTGTLTYGKIKINEINNYSKYSKGDLLNIISNIESNSTHPISKAFEKSKINDLKVKDYKEINGLGIKATINNKEYLIGNRKLLEKNNIENKYIKDEELISSNGNTIIYVVENNKIIALIGLKDIIRRESINTIKQLKEMNKEVIILTGDNEITSNIIVKELNVDNVVSNILPKDKVKYIKKLQKQNKKVMMVGDGINDAPSLATADIGVSFISSTDIATNSSNVIITNDKISNIINIFKISRHTIINIKENLFWAFIYNIVMIIFAIGLFSIKINPMIAAFAMMLSSLCVVLNALRLRKKA